MQMPPPIYSLMIFAAIWYFRSVACITILTSGTWDCFSILASDKVQVTRGSYSKCIDSIAELFGRVYDLIALKYASKQRLFVKCELYELKILDQNGTIKVQCVCAPVWRVAYWCISWYAPRHVTADWMNSVDVG
jgi:hypothetical protein